MKLFKRGQVEDSGNNYLSLLNVNDHFSDSFRRLLIVGMICRIQEVTCPDGTNEVILLRIPCHFSVFQKKKKEKGDCIMFRGPFL